MPKAIRKQRYWMLFSSFGFSAACVGVGFVAEELWPHALPDGALTALNTLGFVGAFALIVWSGNAEKRIRRLVEEYDGCVCTKCAYPLEKTVIEGRCPECGMKYKRDDLRMEWWDYGVEIKRAMRTEQESPPKE